MKKKVLFLIHTLQVGGAEKVLVNLVNKMDKTKYDITVMTVINTGSFRNNLDKDIKYKSIINSKFFNRKSKDNSGNLFNKTSKLKIFLSKIYQFMWRHINCKKIYEKYIKDDYDIEIAFLEGISAKLISKSTNTKSKKIAWIHVDLINETKTKGFFKNHKEEANSYNEFDNIVCVSEVVKKQFIKKFNYDPNKVVVKYNPIDQDMIKLMSNEKIMINKNRLTLCTIGRLSVQKGYDRLIRVVSRLNKDNINFDLWIIGVGAEEDNLRRLIKEYSTNNVYLLGYQKNPYPYIKKSDLFVSSSRAEGFSTVVSEAIILEKPVVTTNCSGMEELLGKDSTYGLICENDEDALYIALKDILTNKEKYEYYKKKVKERKSLFDLDKSIKSIEGLLGD